MIRSIVIGLALAAFVAAGEAQAQGLFRKGMAPAASYRSGSIPGTYGGTSYSSYYAGPGATAGPSRGYTYSYYTLSPLPPRTYVGYGADQFPFAGAPYGHPYDPWTWPMMSGAYGAGLSHYYDPPVK